MSSQTIRDVVIKVAVETVVASASDGLKQIETRASEAEKQVAALLERLNDLSKGHNGGATVVDIQDPDQVPGASISRNRQSGNGAVTAVDDPNQLSPAERTMAHSAGKIQREKQKGRDDQQKRHQGISDNDVANAVKATNKGKQEAKEAAEEEARAVKAGTAAQEAYVGASRAAAMSAMEFARGLALVAASGDNNNDSLIRGIVQIQSYFNLIRSGMSTMQAFNDALKVRAALQAATNAASVAKGAAGGAAPASNAANSAGGATAIPGGLSALANPYVLLAAVAASTLLAVRAMNQLAVEDDRHEKEVETSHAAIGAKHADLAVGRHVDQAIRRSNAVPNIGQSRQGAINQSRRSQIEHEIRKEQDGSDRDFGAKQEMRSRAEEAGGIAERKDEATNNLEHATRQQKVFEEGHKSAREKLISDAKASHAAHEIRVAKIKNSMRKSTGVGRVQGAATGEESDNSANQYNEQKKLELIEAETSRAEQLNREKEKAIQLEEQALRLGQQRAAAAEQLLNTLREQTAAARRNHEKDKQTVASANQQIGALDPGRLFMLKKLEAQRLRGEKFNPSQLQNIAELAPPGSTLHSTGRKQQEERGAGVIAMDVDVKTSKEKQDVAENNQAQQEPELQNLIKTQGDANAKMGQLVQSQTESAMALGEYFAKMQQQLDAQKQLTENAIRSLKDVRSK